MQTVTFFLLGETDDAFEARADFQALVIGHALAIAGHADDVGNAFGGGELDVRATAPFQSGRDSPCD